MSPIKTLTIAILATLIPLSAYAQGTCGQVIAMDTMGETTEYCGNIYERQLEYREQRLILRQRMDERRKEFIAPQAEARENYKKALEDLNNQRTHENDVTGR